MLWSFGKAPKFGLDMKAISEKHCYDLPPVKSARAAGFGYGSKYDFTKEKNGNPPPNNYSLPETINPKNKKNAYSFGLSREAMLVTGGQYVGDKNSPGPGAYDTREINKKIFAYSFKGRGPAPETMTTSRLVPGPGAYPQFSTLSPKGEYFVSKFKNSGASSFAPPKSARFSQDKEGQLPGPGAYDILSKTSPKGSYFISNFQSTQAQSFGHDSRASTSRYKNVNPPGPGTYRVPSDFGHYESARNRDSSKDAALKSARSAAPEESK